MDGLTVIIAAIVTAWLGREHTATEQGSTPPPTSALAPVYRIALGFVVGVFFLAILSMLFVL